MIDRSPRRRAHVHYQDFAIEVSGQGSGGFRARVSHASGDSAPIAFVSPIPMEEIDSVLDQLERRVL
ncbi:MAG: hypothetical protein MI919_09560, partial [Holophagales bacterium]|nr:hypothetical protein [Holophagales bacterium]